MFFIDYGLVMVGLSTLLIHAVLLLVALVCGARSLLRLRRPDGAHGLRLALTALGLCVAVGAWSVLFFAPWRFPNARPWLWMPFIPLPVALGAAVLWGLRGTRVSGIGRLMTVVAVIALTMAAGLGVQRWDRRRECLHRARSEEDLTRRFREVYRTASRCYEHGRRGQPCVRCKNETPSSNNYYAKEFLKDAEQSAARARDWRRRASAW